MINGNNDRNMRLLSLLRTVLRLKPGQIAKAGKVSPAYITRLIKGEISGSDDFWANLNANLLKEAQGGSIFQLSENLPQNADELLKGLAVVESRPATITQVSQVSKVSMVA